MFWGKKQVEKQERPEGKYIAYLCGRCGKSFLRENLILIVSPATIRLYWNRRERDTLMCAPCIDEEAKGLVASYHKPDLVSAYKSLLGGIK